MTTTLQEREAMGRAILLSGRGPANGPNPRVGCVLLNAGGSVIAEGWHRGKGTPHAEVAALSALAHPDLARGATAIVTLEPCNHTGSTGPCSTALIDAGISRVVYAVADPGAASSGGAARLAQAGLSVEAGLLGAEAEANIRPWLTSVRRGTPFVTVKWASSLDGRAAAADGSSQWITGVEARDDVHRRRSEAGAILVGTGTVLADDPGLTARDRDGALLSEQPLAVVVGRRAIARDARVLAHPAGVFVFDGHDLTDLLGRLAARSVHHVFVEGGPTLASAFLAAGLADEVLAYVAPTLLGGPRVAVTNIDVPTITDQRRLSFDSVHRLGDDVLLIAHPLTTTPPESKDS